MMSLVLFNLALALVIIFSLRKSFCSKEDKTYALYLKYKRLHEETGDVKYKAMSQHYHQEWVNENTDG